MKQIKLLIIDDACKELKFYNTNDSISGYVGIKSISFLYDIINLSKNTRVLFINDKDKEMVQFLFHSGSYNFLEIKTILKDYCYGKNDEPINKNKKYNRVYVTEKLGPVDKSDGKLFDTLFHKDKSELLLKSRTLFLTLDKLETNCSWIYINKNIDYKVYITSDKNNKDADIFNENYLIQMNGYKSKYFGYKKIIKDMDTQNDRIYKRKIMKSINIKPSTMEHLNYGIAINQIYDTVEYLPLMDGNHDSIKFGLIDEEGNEVKLNCKLRIELLNKQ